MTDTYIIDAKGRYNINKDPQAVLDYTLDWTTYLAPLADTIASFTVVVAGATLASQSNTTTTTTAWVSGGTVGVLCTATFHIVTAGGRTDEQTIYLKIKDK